MQSQNSSPSNIEAMDQEARACFDSLPQALKAQIVQSGAKLCTREDLESYCRNALEGSQQR